MGCLIFWGEVIRLMLIFMVSYKLLFGVLLFFSRMFVSLCLLIRILLGYLSLVLENFVLVWLYRFFIVSVVIKESWVVCCGLFVSVYRLVVKRLLLSLD